MRDTNRVKQLRVISDSLGRPGTLCLLALLCFGCASTETFENVTPDELTPATLPSGSVISLQYENGISSGFFEVAEVTETTIRAISGREWPKAGIAVLKARLDTIGYGCRDSWRGALTDHRCAGPWW